MRILCLIPLLAGIGVMLVGPDSIPLKGYVAQGSHQLTIDLKKPMITIDSIEQPGPKAPDHVIINEATHEDLVACPGISSKTADLILRERRAAPFFDWRDFDTRVKGMGAGKIERLKEAGVRLNNNE
ncbi:MAG: hypothetical protein PHD82_01705 [Candidatus Riflebacteria bacterium]|nr:hypothetical protein [Candidatus Riflebacteria bacterium]